MSNNLLYQRLSASPIDYIAKTSIGGERANVIFTGVFEDLPVVWNAIIVALPVELSSVAPSSVTQSSPSSVQSTQYIDVETRQPGDDTLLNVKTVDVKTVNVDIGLFVMCVDEPTIDKVIKMIRQYKNLKRGRHEFAGSQK